MIERVLTQDQIKSAGVTDKPEPGRCRYILGHGLAYWCGPRGEKFPLRCGVRGIDEHGLCEKHRRKESQ